MILAEADQDIVFELPGQGTGFAPLVAGLANPNLIGKEDSDVAKEVFEVVSEETGVNVLEVARPDLGTDFMDTRIAQALLLAGGFAGGSILAKRGINAKYFRGHSASGVTAAGLAGALTVRTAAKAMKERGLLMHQAAVESPGTVLVTDLEDEETLDRICKEAGVFPANYNSPNQTMVSGPLEAVKEARQLIKAEGARATIIRDWAAGAVHSPIIAIPAGIWRKFLQPLDIGDSKGEFVRDTDAGITHEGEKIREDLGGMDKPVRWKQGTVALLGMGVSRFVEIGPPKRPDREDHVLQGFLKAHGLEGSVVMEHITDILKLNH